MQNQPEGEEDLSFRHRMSEWTRKTFTSLAPNPHKQPRPGTTNRPDPTSPTRHHKPMGAPTRNQPPKPRPTPTSTNNPEGQHGQDQPRGPTQAGQRPNHHAIPFERENRDRRLRV